MLALPPKVIVDPDPTSKAPVIVLLKLNVEAAPKVTAPVVVPVACVKLEPAPAVMEPVIVPYQL